LFGDSFLKNEVGTKPAYMMEKQSGKLAVFHFMERLLIFRRVEPQNCA
jgi:hypothetical protein